MLIISLGSLYRRGVVMAFDEMRALENLLERMRTLYSEMSGYHGGVSLLHLEAAVASLESHLHRHRITA